MEFKRIIVLANSIKKGGRCVAGRILNQENKISSEWLRPISEIEDGALMPEHVRTNSGKPVEVLDIIDVPVTACANDRCHPEDWSLDGCAWRHVSEFDRSRLVLLEEWPKDLWLENRRKTDTVKCTFLERQKSPQSLYLIRPRSLTLRIWREFDSRKNYNVKKSRAVFNYGFTTYDFSVTDPVFTSEFNGQFPEVGEKPVEIIPSCGDHCLLCVSLTPMFMGCHYKVVASVLELP